MSSSIKEILKQSQQIESTKGQTNEAGVHSNDETTVHQYFKYYSKLANQQNMLID
jgi:hypothetical protein